MGGIQNYFHGEEAEVTDVKWVHDDVLSYVIELAGNPHRKRAQDYASDIGIDPLIKPGDHVVYVRTDQVSGIWVKKGMELEPDLQGAFARIGVNRKRCYRYLDIVDKSRLLANLWARTLPFSTGVRLQPSTLNDSNSFDRSGIPASEESVFLSHSGRNSLIARLLFEDLRKDAKREVWFDLNEAGESPRHDKYLEAWLRNSLFSCRVFVLLLTQASVSSEWVQKEIAWAKARTEEDEDFHLIWLNLEGVKVPSDISADTIDCAGLELGEINEELFSAVYKRSGRREWVEKQTKLGWKWSTNALSSKRQGYEHLMSDGGKAIELRWTDVGPTERWELFYEADGEVECATGIGPYQVVDVDIRPGDNVGGFACGWESPFWMRSDDLKLNTNDVRSKYHAKVGDITKWEGEIAERICFHANLRGSRFEGE